MKKRRPKHGSTPEPPATVEPPKAEPSAAPSDAALTRVRVVFAAFVALQILVPLSYYAREDRYDERFAWRMFSAIRVGTCDTRASETRDRVETPLVLADEIHYAWIEHLGRNRRRVIDRFLESRCARAGVTRATLVNVCHDAEGERTPDVRYEHRCGSGTLKTTTADADSGGAR